MKRIIMGAFAALAITSCAVEEVNEVPLEDATRQQDANLITPEESARQKEVGNKSGSTAFITGIDFPGFSDESELSFVEYEGISGQSSPIVLTLDKPAPPGGTPFYMGGATTDLLGNLEGSFEVTATTSFTVPEGVQTYTLPFEMIMAPIDREVPIIARIYLGGDYVRAERNLSRIDRDIRITKAPITLTQTFSEDEEYTLIGAANTYNFHIIKQLPINLAVYFPPETSAAFEYTIEAPVSGTYLLGIYYAADNPDGTSVNEDHPVDVTLTVNGTASDFQLRDSGGVFLQNGSIAYRVVELNTGSNTIALSSDNQGDFGVDKMNFIPYDGTSTPISICSGIEEWVSGQSYEIGDQVTFRGRLYTRDEIGWIRGDEC